MSMGDKITHEGEEAVGKVKEVTGKVTGNEDLEARGEAGLRCRSIAAALCAR